LPSIQFGLTQFDAFAIGALIALNERRIRASNRAFPAVASVALGALAIYAAIYYRSSAASMGFPCDIDGHYAQVWLYSVLDLLSAALLVAVVTGCNRSYGCVPGKFLNISGAFRSASMSSTCP